MRDPGNQPTSAPLGGRQSVVIWVVIAVLLGSWAWLELQRRRQDRSLSYSAFRAQVEQGNVERVTAEGDRITGKLREPAKDASDGLEFVTHLPEFGDRELLLLLEKNDVELRVKPAGDGGWWPVILAVSPIILLVGLGILMWRGMKSQGRGMLSVGRNKARLYQRAEEHTTFDEVAGAASAKTELTEIVDFLRRPGRYERLGGKVPRGALLVGPPGTGKTLLARAVAGEAEVPFFSITGSDFMEMFVGVGASRVRNMFGEAKKLAPSIIFIDELDSIGRRRGAGMGGGHDEREQTLNQLLSELDGFEPSESVIVLAATNRPDILDPALLRPGRFDRQVTVDLPTVDEREAILRIHAGDRPLSDAVDLGEVARSTPGFSGADLENLINEAALIATRADKDRVEPSDVEEARDKVVMGLEREGLSLDAEECRLLASHEAGHAVVAATLPGMDPVHKVSIVPRGRAMGATHQLPRTERYIHTREQLEQRLAVMLGGRAAEVLLEQTLTNGAEDDLKQATQLARRMVLSWGMGTDQTVAYGDGESTVFLGEELGRPREYSEATARELDRDVRAALDGAFRRATAVLRERRDGVDRVVEALLDREELSGAEVLELIGEPELTNDATAAPAA